MRLISEIGLDFKSKESVTGVHTNDVSTTNEWLTNIGRRFRRTVSFIASFIFYNSPTTAPQT